MADIKKKEITEQTDIKPTIDTTPKYTPLNKILKSLRKTGSVTDTAKILGLNNSAIYARLKRHGIDMEEFNDYTEDKALSHEILQYRIAKSIDTGKIQKMSAGSAVLAICQLEDKQAQIRGTGQANTSINIVINAIRNACDDGKTIDVTPPKD
ncbi:hypothetical protein KAR91_05710 [Candidatus Pacearchaeota archaeon]|nr:hypothetical protein [Candidatus Pacearchaeota archaeon]